MRLLLDTHVVLWLVTAPSRVPASVRGAVVDADALGVSIASAWEYGAKRSRRPEQLPLPFDRLLVELPVEAIALEWSCRRYAEDLPRFHNDPFDRMLIAQALEGRWTLVTADRDIQRYPVPTLW